jgi:hypothetical protein
LPASESAVALMRIMNRIVVSFSSVELAAHSSSNDWRRDRHWEAEAIVGQVLRDRDTTRVQRYT